MVELRMLVELPVHWMEKGHHLEPVAVSTEQPEQSASQFVEELGSTLMVTNAPGGTLKLAVAAPVPC